MAINISDLFTKLGAIFKGIDSIDVFLGNGNISAGGLLSVGAEITNIQAEFDTDFQFVIDGLYTQRDNTRQSLDSLKSYLSGLAQTALLEVVDADVTLVTRDVPTAMTELIVQMIGAGTVFDADDDVDASAVTATVTASSLNTGTGVVVATTKRTDGRTAEYALSETVDIVCTGDALVGSGTARSEPFSVKGEPAVANQLAWNWPKGSGATGDLTTGDADHEPSEGLNLVANSNFEDFTSNIPDSWAILVGSAGTTIIGAATPTHRSSGKALEFVGDGSSTLSSVAYTFATALLPNTRYAVNFWARKSADLLAGVIECRLLDGSNAVVADDAGTNNAFTVAHGSLSDSAWTAVNGVFITPRVLPSTVKINLRVSTALTDTESVYIDDLCMVTMTELYVGGPALAAFAGATNFLVGDKFSVAISNNGAGLFQKYFQRVFDMRTLGLQLPSDSAGGETLDDALIA